MDANRQLMHGAHTNVASGEAEASNSVYLPLSAIRKPQTARYERGTTDSGVNTRQY